MTSWRIWIDKPHIYHGDDPNIEIMCQRISNGVLTLCALVEAMSYAKRMTSILINRLCIYTNVCLSELKSYIPKVYMTLPRPHHRAGVSCSMMRIIDAR